MGPQHLLWAWHKEAYYGKIKCNLKFSCFKGLLTQSQHSRCYQHTILAAAVVRYTLWTYKRGYSQWLQRAALFSPVYTYTQSLLPMYSHFAFCLVCMLSHLRKTHMHTRRNPHVTNSGSSEASFCLWGAVTFRPDARWLKIAMSTIKLPSIQIHFSYLEILFRLAQTYFSDKYAEFYIFSSFILVS